MVKQMHRWIVPGLAGLAVAAAGCGERVPTSPATMDDHLFSTAGAPGQFSFYGMGGQNSNDPHTTCATPEHDQFDFWVGEWDALSSDQVVGTNRILNLLDNCLVEENWTDTQGSRGRSMNTYDAASGEWSQYWIDQNGTHLRLTGGLDGDAMLMRGDHKIRNPLGNIVPIIHRIRWTPNQDGTVRQLWDAAPNGSPTFFLTFFDGTYVPSADFAPAPPLAQSFCTDPQYDELDFMIGSWTVETAGGRELGTSVIREDLENCMLEEDFSSIGGYESQSFFGWDYLEQAWYRNHVDSDGMRIVLSGGSQGDGVVLTGSRARSGDATLAVRLTIVAESPGRIVHSWETSNGNGPFHPAGEVVFVRN